MLCARLWGKRHRDMKDDMAAALRSSMTLSGDRHTWIQGARHLFRASGG